MKVRPVRGLVAQIYVENSDALFERAVAAGATVLIAIGSPRVARAA